MVITMLKPLSRDAMEVTRSVFAAAIVASIEATIGVEEALKTSMVVFGPGKNCVQPLLNSLLESFYFLLPPVQAACRREKAGTTMLYAQLTSKRKLQC